MNLAKFGSPRLLRPVLMSPKNAAFTDAPLFPRLRENLAKERQRDRKRELDERETERERENEKIRESHRSCDAKN